MLICCSQLISFQCFSPHSPRTSEQTRHQTNGVGLLSLARSAALSQTQPHTHTDTDTQTADLCSLARSRSLWVTVTLAACSWWGRAAADQGKGTAQRLERIGRRERRAAIDQRRAAMRPQSPIDGDATSHTSHSTRAYDSTDASLMVCTPTSTSRRCAGWRR